MAELNVELIQKLRATSGAGMLDCKKTLTETNGDFDKALQILREKGKTQALKKVGRETKNGLISSYIHPGDRIGVMLEVNCETDFVAKTDDFKKLVKEIGLQIAAASPAYLNRESIPKDVLDKEKEIYRKQVLDEGKPEKIVEKIVEGKLEKFYQQVCLLDQPYIRDASGKEKITDLVKAVIAKTGENIQVRRFVRFQLGEEL
ncbi:MAG: translation elongation factor Ts [Elusimicrobia bacterium RIFOXYA2_FULL_39_19]|nr:MAG: translation elongation factor Ts [Elusimicrobia bacterium RIFOXYA2_FULL_39_19]